MVALLCTGMRLSADSWFTTLAGATILVFEARNEQEKVCAGKRANLVIKTVALAGFSANEARKDRSELRE
ncbi:hypothetical protein D9V82_10155 [Corynebacterium macginleyi]|nr:hypothetical protein D9V82_10155 [Corynebacterium macginleyi]